jgi:hypothetical protein
VLEIGKMTLEEFREEYQHSVNNVKTKVVFEALHNLAEQVLSKPPVEIIEEAKKQWIPFLMELNDINFSYALNDFKEQLMVLHSNKLNFSLNGPEGILQSLSMVLQKTDENLSEYKKDRIISIMSNVDAAQSPVRSMKK